MSDLIAILEAATEGSRELDARIAMEFGGYSAWKSKHGYWNIEGPGEERMTCEGRDPVVRFDPETGKPLPAEEVPLGWIWDAKFEEVTTSLDAALAFAEAKLPEHDWSVGHLPTDSDVAEHEHHIFGCLLYEDRRASPGDAIGHGATAPLAVCTALLRALKNVTDGR